MIWSRHHSNGKNLAFLLSAEIFNATLAAEKMASMKSVLVKKVRPQESYSEMQLLFAIFRSQRILSNFVLLLYPRFSNCTSSGVWSGLRLSIASVCQTSYWLPLQGKSYFTVFCSCKLIEHLWERLWEPDLLDLLPTSLLYYSLYRVARHSYPIYS